MAGKNRNKTKYTGVIGEKQSYIQGLRIVAAYAVVLIHIIYQGYLDFPIESTEGYLFLFNFLCFAVPIFVMITGWVWLKPDKMFPVKRYVRKILLPLFTYGTLFSFMEQVFEKKCVDIKMLPLSILYVVQGKSWAHLWYLYMLLGIYICLPVIKHTIKELTNQQLFFMIIVLFGFNSVIVDIEKIFSVNIAFYIPVSGIFVMYLLLGHYLDSIQLKSGYLALSWSGLIVLITILSCWGIRLDSMAYNDVPTVWLSINVYVSFIKAQSAMKRLFENVKILTLIAENTFGIYLIHMVFVNLLYKFFNVNPYHYRVVPFWFTSSLFIFLLSLLTTIAIRKIPVVNRVFSV